MKNRKKLLEVCVDSVESALEACKGGADRLELCSNLMIGGTTPGLSCFSLVKEQSSVPVHVLIRPRFGDFCYSQMEFEMMRRDIRAFKEAGADGVVIGILSPDGHLDLKRMRTLVVEAHPMSVTLHRAFDLCREPKKALLEAISLGIDTILSSGQEADALKGAPLLKELATLADGRIDLMAGSGISPSNIEAIASQTGLHSFHMSAKIQLESPMIYRKKGVPMGLPILSEYVIFRTDASLVRKAKNILSCQNRE